VFDGDSAPDGKRGRRGRKGRKGSGDSRFDRGSKPGGEKENVSTWGGRDLCLGSRLGYSVSCKIRRRGIGRGEEKDIRG